MLPHDGGSMMWCLVVSLSFGRIVSLTPFSMLLFICFQKKMNEILGSTKKQLLLWINRVRNRAVLGLIGLDVGMHTISVGCKILACPHCQYKLFIFYNLKNPIKLLICFPLKLSSVTFDQDKAYHLSVRLCFVLCDSFFERGQGVAGSLLVE